MAKNENKIKKRVNPFDVVIVLLVLCLVATFVYRIYTGVANKGGDSNLSNYVLTFRCEGTVDSVNDYFDEGEAVYLSVNGELLGYVSSKMTVEEVTSEGEEADTSTFPYKTVNITCEIRLSRDVNVHNNGVYYSAGSVNFAPGSTIQIYTEEVALNVVVESVSMQN